MSRAPSRLPSMSPMSGALVPYQPRAPSATPSPSPSRKRSLGMIRDMSPAVSSPYQNRLTRFSSPMLDSLPRLPRFQEPVSRPPRDIDSLRRLRHDRDGLPQHDPCPVSPWQIPTLVVESAEQKLPIMIDVDETLGFETLERGLLLLLLSLRPPHSLLSPV